METERLHGKTINPDKMMHRIMNAEIYNLTVISTVSLFSPMSCKCQNKTSWDVIRSAEAGID